MPTPHEKELAKVIGGVIGCYPYAKIAPANVDAYVATVTEFTVETVNEACMACCMKSPDFMPSAMAIRKKCLEIEPKMQPLQLKGKRGVHRKVIGWVITAPGEAWAHVWEDDGREVVSYLESLDGERRDVPEWGVSDVG